MRAFVIGGTHSGCGKTTVALGLCAALRKKGRIVQPFKAGPDFIDSGLHKLAAGRTSRNLDLWMCGEAYVRNTFLRHGDADAAVIEGVMGLYDGAASTAALAGVLSVPVVLVIDAYGMAESAAPIIRGMREWGANRLGIDVKGVIFNRVASARHYERLCARVEGVMPLGYLPTRRLLRNTPQALRPGRRGGSAHYARRHRPARRRSPRPYRHRRT